MAQVRKITGYILIGLILVFTVVAVLGIWDVIDMEDVMIKVFTSLLVVFIASAVVLFITTVLIKDDTTRPS